MNATQIPALDLDFVRGHFPALASDWVFMDNAGGSVPLANVAGRAADYLRETPFQLGATYPGSVIAQARLDQAAADLATLVNARDVREVIVGPSTSALISRLARAMRPLLSAGDEIIVTNADHEANISPWRRLSESGITVRTWSLNRDSLRLELDELDPLMNDRTRLVCFTHTSNILGSIVPVEDITRFVHERGAEVCVDGVAYAPHHALDVQAWDVDYYVFSLYKVYGPHQAVMVGRRERLESLDNINHYFFKAGDVPAKFQPGGSNYELTYACGAVPEYVCALGARHGASTVAGEREQMMRAYEAMTLHEETLAAALLDWLDSRADIRIIGERRPDRSLRSPTISFVVGDRDSAGIPPEIDKHQVAIRWGHFYAPRLIEHLGLSHQNGVVRASLVHYNTLEEVTRLIGALEVALRT